MYGVSKEKCVGVRGEVWGKVRRDVGSVGEYMG